MNSQEYNFKYRYIYPLLGLLLYFLLLIMLIFALNRHFDFFSLNIFTSLPILLFLIEAVVRFNAGLKLKIPVFTWLVEVSIYLALLFVALGLSSSGEFNGFREPGLWIVFVMGIIGWLNINELANYYNFFRVDCEKIFGKSGGRSAMDDFRRMLDYPSVWKKLSRKVSILNFLLPLIWAIYGQYSLFLLTGTVLFVFLEFLLLTLTYLDKKAIDWYVEGIDSPALRGDWFKYLIIVILIAVAFAGILPYNYSPIPMEAIGHWLGSVDIRLEEMPQDERPDIRTPTEQIGQPPEGGSVNILQIIFVIIQILIYISFLFIIIAMIFFLFRLEFRKIKNIPDFFRKFILFIRNFIREIFSSMKKLKFNFDSENSGLRKKRQEKRETGKEKKRLKDITLPTNIRSMVITIYNSMLRLLSFRGRERKKYQTPYEYGRMVVEDFKDIEEEIGLITRFYVEVSYSDHSLGESTVHLLKGVWDKLRKAL
ncbi:MAG: DUF4129 domain-containing protein [Halanaerobiales bacterium]